LEISEDQLEATTLEGTRDELLGIVVHELTHATDRYVHGADLSSCLALACSEVRAYDLGGQCDPLETDRQRRNCIRHGAVLSSMDRCEENTASLVLGVFERCYGTPMEHNVTTAWKTADAGLK
jgi:hypothetical protein